MKMEQVQLLLVMPFFWLCLCNQTFLVSGLCLDDQSSLLLQLKNNLTILPKSSSSKLESWNPNHDCCNWLGVTCDKEGHVTGLNLSRESISSGLDNSSSLFSLKHLQELNLAYNNFTSDISSGFNKLESWTHLTRLENLSVIILSGNNFSSPVPEFFANFKNLTTLRLAHCGLTGEFPQKIFKIGTLSVINLSFNFNLQGSFPEFPLNGSLQTIRVRNTNFFGKIPHTIGNMGSLTKLDLQNCQFNGTLPSSLSNIIKLNYLDLSDNSFTGPMPSFSMLKRLEYLDLSYNSLSGDIPSSLFSLPLSQSIILRSNQFTNLDEFSNVSSSVLKFLDLSFNNLCGPFPTSIFQLTSLSFLYISDNKFNGSVQLVKFSNLMNLTTLNLSRNKISVNVSLTSVGPYYFPNLKHLYLESCNLNIFPSFLRNTSGLVDLKLSQNQIQGTVPNWIWELEHLMSLNISHNFLNDFEGHLQNITSILNILVLHNNQFQGPLPVFLKYAVYLDFSRNKFCCAIPRDIGNYLSQTMFLSLSNNALHGNIPDSFCNASYLELLDVSMNNISGTIPSCLINMSDTLGVLNLKMNHLTGHIPDMFPTSCVLRTLHLQKNRLYGQIPKSLSNCLKLQVLDLAKNQITGGFPCLLKNITTLRVIILRENKFYGPIRCPKFNDTWHMLQILDLASNKFSGELPRESFTKWTTMMSDESEANFGVNHIQYQLLAIGGLYYKDSATVTIKGQQMELVKILTIFTAVDFSSNHFQGEIPKQLFDFKALYVLNLSNNALSGQIPSSIRNLKHLESLDLSHNSLKGEIPTELASLSFLSVLNLSFNQLSGKIPTGTQIQSFPKTSFINNKGLYGPPLSMNKSYPNNTENTIPPVTKCGRLGCSIEWNFLSVEVGFVSSIGILIGTLLFWKKGRVWYWQLVHKILCWIFPRLYLEHVNHRGKSYMVLRWR